MRLLRALPIALLLFSGLAAAEPNAVPLYKPSSRSPEAINILSNAYGGHPDAPHALEVGDLVSNFHLPRAGGGVVTLGREIAAGPTVLIFYRGHW